MKTFHLGALWTPVRMFTALTAYLACTCNPAFAVSLSFVPSAQVVSVGDTAQVDIVVSDPNFGTTIGVVEFDIGTRFDTTILADETELMPTDAVFHGHLGIPGTETTAIWGVFEDVATDVVVTREISFLNQTDLFALQSPSFILATLYFEALTPGTSLLEFSSVSIVGPGPNVDITTTSASITVVPLPPAIYLFGSGLIGLVGIARRKQRFQVAEL